MLPCISPTCCCCFGTFEILFQNVLRLAWFANHQKCFTVLFIFIAYFSASSQPWERLCLRTHGYAGWTPKRCWGKRYLWADPIPGLSQKYTKYTCKIRCILPPKEPTILGNKVSSWFMCSNGDTRNKQWLWFSMSSVFGLNSYWKDAQCCHWYFLHFQLEYFC